MEAALINTSFHPGAAIYRRFAVGPEMIETQAGGCIDYWLFYQLVRTGRPLMYVGDRLMRYREHAAGFSKAMPEPMVASHIYVQRQILGDPKMAQVHSAIRISLAKVVRAQGNIDTAKGRYLAGLASLVESYRLQPSFRTVLAVVNTLALNLPRRSLRQLGNGAWTKRLGD
jgi:hypothetical protein